MPTTGPRSDAMQRCIEHCFSCAATCVETIAHCLTLGGPHAEAGHIGLMQTCAEICTVSGNAMLRRLDAHAVSCRACAEICSLCARDCERLSGDDEAMRRCAEACRACAETCAAMAAG